MSTLTSLMKNGKRMIVKTRTGFRTTTKTALGQSDRGVSQDPMRPQEATLDASNMTTLGRSDKGVSQDPMRPEHETRSPDNMTALGRPDQKVAQDPVAPQDDPEIRA